MHTGTGTLLSISATISLAVIATALALLVVWQDPRRRSNQYFGLASVDLALYAIFSTLWQVSQQFDLAPRQIFYTTSTLYLIALVLLYKFALVFGEVPTRIRRAEHVVSALLLALAIFLIGSDRVYVHFEPLSTGAYSFDVTSVGYMGFTLALAYLASCIILLHWQRSPKARALSVPLVVMIVGVFGFSSVPVLRHYAFNAFAVMAAMIILGRLIIKFQVFQPLEDLNAELALKNAEILEASRAKSQFLANMSHELRTPLNSIIGYTDLLLNRTYGDLADLQADRLTKVRGNGRLLLELINDVLDLSRIEAGRLDLTFARIDTTNLLDGVVQQFSTRALEKGLALIRGYADLPPLWGDESRARQIFINLLSNAVKFTEHGCVIVRGHYDPGAHQVIISITDTGIGIAPEQQASIFDAFTQVDGSSTRRQDGTGLGLAIVRHLTEMHDGYIWFESVEGRGSSFHVALPAAPDITPATPIVKPRHRTGPIVLIIDRDCAALYRFQEVLEVDHLRVYGACNANDGLMLAHDLHPDLIALDLELSGTDDGQLLDALRHDPATAAVPVLLMAGPGGAGDRAAHAAGAVLRAAGPLPLREQIRRLLAEPTRKAGSL